MTRKVDLQARVREGSLTLRLVLLFEEMVFTNGKPSSPPAATLSRCGGSQQVLGSTLAKVENVQHIQNEVLVQNLIYKIVKIGRAHV